MYRVKKQEGKQYTADGFVQWKEIPYGEEQEQRAGLQGEVLNKYDSRVGGGEQMYQLEEPGIPNGSYAHQVMTRCCIDVSIAVGKIIGKRIAKFEDDKLNNNSSKATIEVSLIVGIFEKEPRKGTGIIRIAGADTIFNKGEPG